MAHKIAVRRSSLDESGTDMTRSLEDLRRIHHCPLEEILKSGSDSKCAKQMEEDLKELQKKGLQPDENLMKTSFEDRLKQLEPHMETIHKLLILNKDAPEDFPAFREKLHNTLENKGHENEEKKQIIYKFNFLVDVFDRLYTNPWVRKAHVYRHVVSSVTKKPGQDDIDIDLKPTTVRIKFWYILFPMIMFFFSFGFQSFMLHLATHYYIFYMDHEKGDNKRQEQGGQLLDVFGNLVGKIVSGGQVSGQGAVYMGNVNFDLRLLDLTAAIPLFFCMMAYAVALATKTFNIGLWNKTFIVASSMAVIKGIFDVVTILPDSTGWENCKERLGEKTGLQSLRDLDFVRDLWGSIWNQLFHEVVGGGGKNGGRVRYCADMMVSGHTYFACLFCLSAYKQIAYIADSVPKHPNKPLRNFVFVVCFVSLSCEVVLVALARFHYTVDMMAAIVLVFLLFDSRCIEQLAADWSEGYVWRDPNFVPRCSFQYIFCCKWCEPPAEQVLPSQGTCFNHRLIAGKGIWVEPDDDVEAYPGHERVKAGKQEEPGGEFESLLAKSP